MIVTTAPFYTKAHHSNRRNFRRCWHGQASQQHNVVMAATCAGPLLPPEQENSGLVGNPPRLSSHPQQSQFKSRFHTAAAHVTVSSSSQSVQHNSFRSSCLASYQESLVSNSNPVAPTSIPPASRATPLAANAIATDRFESCSSAAVLTEVRLVKTKHSMP